MNKKFRFIAALLFAVSLHSVVAAEERGTASEAVALVKKAVASMKADGREKTFAEINDPKGRFVDKDLYVYAATPDGVMLAHGANPRLIGKDLSQMKDADGRLITKATMELAQTKGKGWIDYKWPNPVTKAIEVKSTYVERVDDVVFGCGIYKQ